MSTPVVSPPGREKITDDMTSSPSSAGGPDCNYDEDDDSPPLLPHERVGASDASLHPTSNGLHPYPTPPVSTSPSLHRLKLSDSASEEGQEDKKSPVGSSTHHESMSEAFPPKARRSSMLDPLSSILTPSNVHAAHFSSPSDRSPTNSPAPDPAHERVAFAFSAASPSYDKLTKLTDDAGLPREKSQPGTPTRALSQQSVKSDASLSELEKEKVVQSGKSSTSEGEASASSTSGAVVAPRGKLTVKILEARGLRRSRDPYVVATFQRNELVSKGPRDEEVEEEDEDVKNTTGGIPIMRTTSDNGRPMAIPMERRQSSNTGIDYRDSRNKMVKSITDPKWDMEAAL
jgi:hypothetical protein